MQARANAVVLLTGIPIGAVLIGGGFARQSLGEIAAGLLVVVVIGVPPWIADVVRHWRDMP